MSGDGDEYVRLWLKCVSEILCVAVAKCVAVDVESVGSCSCYPA